MMISLDCKASLGLEERLREQSCQRSVIKGVGVVETDAHVYESRNTHSAGAIPGRVSNDLWGTTMHRPNSLQNTGQKNNQ